MRSIWLLVALVACKDGDVNLFTVEDDLQLGADLAAQIDADPVNFPPLDREDHPLAYAHLERIRDVVLESPDVQYASDFPWEITILDDDDVVNAFAVPGGYLWVYTGLIKFLESEDQLAGVLGHEIAHADRRHSTEQLTKRYGLSVLLELAFGDDPNLAAQVAAGLVDLSFSRTQESDADDYSVLYLCDSTYAADGSAGFFELMEGGQGVPEFLSTHPDPEGRIEAIHALADELGCNTEPDPDADYEAVVSSLDKIQPAPR